MGKTARKRGKTRPILSERADIRALFEAPRSGGQHYLETDTVTHRVTF
jgi:hypothetical protein